jgi:hypothetical protein
VRIVPLGPPRIPCAIEPADVRTYSRPVSSALRPLRILFRQHYLRELRESLSDSRCSWVLDKSRPHFEGVERVE